MPKNSQFLIDIGQGLSVTIGLPTISAWEDANRPKNAKTGTFGFNLETKNLEYWDGENWFIAEMSED